jgi:hypothetical protein
VGVPAIDWLREKLGILIGSAQGIYVKRCFRSNLTCAINYRRFDQNYRKKWIFNQRQIRRRYRQVINGTGIGDFLSNLTGKTAVNLEKQSAIWEL